MIGQRLARAAFVALAGLAAVTSFPAAASAHTLASSSVRIVEGDKSLLGTISLAVGALDKAFDEAHRSTTLGTAEYEAQVIAYLDTHLTIQGSDAVPWPERYRNYQRQTSEGIETVSVEFSADPQGKDPEDFAITYDAIIEAEPKHEAVLVVESRSREVSTPGVFTASNPVVIIGEGATEVAVADMIAMGLHHVLDGADHLLFLITLLLPAPLIIAGRRWERGPGLRPSLRNVVHVVTAFTIGHSLTLIATSLGWITVPSQPIEVLIAVSVAVSAVHAMRPLVPGGEPLIAGTFGLIHGMAFAGILSDLGLAGKTSVLALLAFNVGIELAQLAVTACVFPSLYAMSRTRYYGFVRTGGATLALIGALGWMGDRLGIFASPFSSIEDALVSHLWWCAAAIAALAAITVSLETSPLPTSHGRRERGAQQVYGGTSPVDTLGGATGGASAEDHPEQSEASQR
jgi:hypothetical protein